MRALLVLTFCLLASSRPLAAQRGAKQTARDLFYAEAGLVVSPDKGSRGKFAAAKKSVVAVTLGVKYRIWKVTGGAATEADPAGAFTQGESIRLGVETNDTGYLYIVRRQPSGMWRRVFPTPEIEGGNHFIRSGVTYPIPPEEGLDLSLPSGAERLFLVLSRSPVKDLEVLVGPRQPENTVSAAPDPEIPETVVEKVRGLATPKDLLTERTPGEKAVYIVNRTARPDSVVVTEIRLSSR